MFYFPLILLYMLILNMRQARGSITWRSKDGQHIYLDDNKQN